MATHVVTGEQYWAIDGQMLEIKRQLRQPKGSPIDPDEVVAALQAIAQPKKKATKQASAGKVDLEGAAEILGDDFHWVADAESVFGVELGVRDKRRLESTKFNRSVLEAAKGDWVLYPVLSLSLMDAHSATAGEFYPTQRQDPWFGHSNQRDAFSNKVVEQAGWYLHRKEAEPDSPGEHYARQQGLMRSPYFVPHPAVSVQAWLLHEVLSHEKLFRHYWVRTDAVTASGSRVHLRGHANGLVVSSWTGSADGYIGVSSARKLR